MAASLDLVDITMVVKRARFTDLEGNTWEPVTMTSDWGTLTLVPTDARMAAAVDSRGRVHVDSTCHRKGRRRFIRAHRRADGTWFVVRHLGHWIQDILGIQMMVMEGRAPMCRTVILGPVRPRSSE